MRFTAVDPGDKYCGIAWFEPDPWRCVSCITVDPAECVDRLWRQLENQVYGPDRLVVEEYRIRPNEGNEWSTCETIKVIGALEHKARQCGVPFDLQTSRILVPTAARVRRQGIQILAGTAHTDSAQLHGWHRILNPRNGLAHQV